MSKVALFSFFCATFQSRTTKKSAHFHTFCLSLHSETCQILSTLYSYMQNHIYNTPNVNEHMKLLFLHTHKYVHSHSTVKLNGVLSNLTSWRWATHLHAGGAFTSISGSVIIIISPDWRIGAPNLTSLYRETHSCRTSVTLYYDSQILSYALHVANC